MQSAKSKLKIIGREKRQGGTILILAETTTCAGGSQRVQNLISGGIGSVNNIVELVKTCLTIACQKVNVRSKEN